MEGLFFLARREVPADLSMFVSFEKLSGYTFINDSTW